LADPHLERAPLPGDARRFRRSRGFLSPSARRIARASSSISKGFTIKSAQRKLRWAAIGADVMRMTDAGCGNRSKGPRFRFRCEEHLKLPRKKQSEVLAKWAEKNGSPAKV